MKTPAIQRLRQKLATDEAVYGLWITLESASVSEMAVALGLDWIVIDAEHGHLDWKEILEHVRVTRSSSTTPLVRIQEIEQGLIKRTLDTGAAGILVPQVSSAEEVKLAVRFAKYPACCNCIPFSILSSADSNLLDVDMLPMQHYFDRAYL